MKDCAKSNEEGGKEESTLRTLREEVVVILKLSPSYCLGLGFGIMEKKTETSIMENQMEKKMENEMETGIFGKTEGFGSSRLGNLHLK